MILESLESGFLGTFGDTKSIPIACWYHIKPKNIMAYFNNQHLQRPCIHNEELASHIINTLWLVKFELSMDRL